MRTSSSNRKIRPCSKWSANSPDRTRRPEDGVSLWRPEGFAEQRHRRSPLSFMCSALVLRVCLSCRRSLEEDACAPWRGFENPDLWMSNRAARRGVIQGLLSKGTRLLFNVNVCIGCADCSFKAYAGQRKEEMPLNVSGAAPNCFLLFSFFELRWIFTFKSQIVRIALIGYFNFLYQLKGHNCLYI